jgi:polyribonucleotide nucleotidyltransferase
MLGAVMFGHESYQPVIDMIEDLAKDAGKPKWYTYEPDPAAEEVAKKVQEMAEADLREAYKETVKLERQEKVGAVRTSVKDAFAEDEEASAHVGGAFKNLEKDIVRRDILKTGKRIDGRDTKTVRPIVCEVGVLPRAHGSALFTRGETQALAVTTLGTGQDEQIMDALAGEYRQHFLLHYNFPPYSVGEAGRFMGAGRREIGHGKLAWRAINPLMPTKEDFPYTIRIVSEITECR